MKSSKTFLLPLSVIILALVSGVLLWSASGFLSASAQAVYQTPTPDAEGRIYYTVEAGDTCTRIFLLTNVSIDDIIRLNGLTESCNLIIGTKDSAWDRGGSGIDPNRDANRHNRSGKNHPHAHPGTWFCQGLRGTV